MRSVLSSELLLCFDTAGNALNDYINNYALRKPSLSTKVNTRTETTKFSHEHFSGLQSSILPAVPTRI